MGNLKFDATAVEPSAPRGALPPGDYLMMIEDSELKDTKSGNGQYLQLTMTVLEGPHAKSKAWARLNIHNANPTAVEIAQRDLSSICHAVGKLQVDDSVELHNIPLIVTMKKDRNDPERSEIAGYKKADGQPINQPRQAQAANTSAGAVKAQPPWAKAKAA